jgi:integrase/recombinase XerD
VARVQRVEHGEMWAVLDSDGIPIREVTAFLRYLHAVERSPHTIKGYASDLALFFTFVEENELSWKAVDNEALGQFIRRLRAPDERLVRSGNPDGIRSSRTVNRALAAIGSFARYLHDTTSDGVYEHLLRTATARVTRFSESPRVETRVGPRLRAVIGAPKVLDDKTVELILDACLSLRDRFLFSVLDRTGMRIGQALLLRHEDIRVPSSSILVQRHESDARNREVLLRNKSENFSEVPVPPWLIRLYAGYMNTEYGLIDSDFVFVNLRGGRIGRQMTYSTVEKLVGRLRKRTGTSGWSAHTFRHTYVTRLLGAGVRPEAVAYLVTHSSVLTTLNTYSHLSLEDVRTQLIEAGAWS